MNTPKHPPLPPGLPTPLPRHLRWCQVMACFQHWNVGGKDYLSALVEVKAVVPVDRPHRKRGKLYPTEQVIACCPER